MVENLALVVGGRALGIEGKSNTEENTKRKKVNFETNRRLLCMGVVG